MDVVVHSPQSILVFRLCLLLSSRGRFLQDSDSVWISRLEQQVSAGPVTNTISAPFWCSVLFVLLSWVSTLSAGVGNCKQFLRFLPLSGLPRNGILGCGRWRSWRGGCKWHRLCDILSSLFLLPELSYHLILEARFRARVHDEEVSPTLSLLWPRSANFHFVCGF